ncbi:MAG: hypothetical protein ACI35S_06330 [Anaeroplasma sp.]
MHPIDLILNEYGITRYQFNKEYGFSKNRLSNLILRNTPVENLQVDLIHAMSVCFKITMDEVYEKLLAYQNNK